MGESPRRFLQEAEFCASRVTLEMANGVLCFGQCGVFECAVSAGCPFLSFVEIEVCMSCHDDWMSRWWIGVLRIYD